MRLKYAGYSHMNLESYTLAGMEMAQLPSAEYFRFSLLEKSAAK